MRGGAEFGQGHYDTSIEEYHKALDGGFRTYFTYSSLAAAYALEGAMEEAKTALAEPRRLYEGNIEDISPVKVMADLGIVPGEIDLIIGGPPARRSALPETESLFRIRGAPCYGSSFDSLMRLSPGSS